MTIRAALFVAIIFAPPLCKAESSDDSVTIDAVLATTLTNSPLVREIDNTVAQRLSEAIELRTLDNPAFNAEVRNPVSSGSGSSSTEVELTLSQPLRISQFGLRSNVAALIEQAGDSDRKIALVELLQTVRLAYAKLWALTEKQKLLESTRSRSDSVSAKLREGAKQGLINTADERLFAAESRKITAELIGVRADIGRARAELIRLSGAPLPSRRMTKPALRPLTRTASEMAQNNGVPLMQRLALLERLAGRQAELARKDALPRFAPMIGYERTGDAGDLVVVGFSMDLPFFDRNQTEQARRAGELGSARAKSAYTRSEAFTTELDQLIVSLQATDEQVREYERSVIPAVREAVTLYDRQVREGQGSVQQLWQTQRELADTSDRSIELVVKAVAARAELSALVGQDI